MSEPTDLLEAGRRALAHCVEALRRHGIETNPGLELRRGAGVLCYYDLSDGHIYLSVPAPDDPLAKLKWLMMRQVLACDSEQSLRDLASIFIPCVVAHELGHHLRHHHGTFTKNHWLEEQLANRFAMAFVKSRFSPAARDVARAAIRRALDALRVAHGFGQGGVESYHNVAHALEALGHVDGDGLEAIEVAQKLFPLELDSLLEELPLPSEVSARIQNREVEIDTINRDYAADQVRYIYNQLAWVYISLSSSELEHLDDLARHYLARPVPLLSAPEPLARPDERAIRACFDASARVSIPAARRYFYKRYRSLLIDAMRESDTRGALGLETLDSVVDTWNDDEPDILTYLARLAPDELRPLFPRSIARGRDLDPSALPAETDRRLWARAEGASDDEAAQNTLDRLALLEAMSTFRSIPAEGLVELARAFCRLRLEPGEVVIWEGDRSLDAFAVVRGKLEARVWSGASTVAVGSIGEGEVFGEMAFLTRNPRSATVVALEATDCLVLKASDLKLFALRHPATLLHLARRLAELLTEKNARGSAPRDTAPS